MEPRLCRQASEWRKISCHCREWHPQLFDRSSSLQNYNYSIATTITIFSKCMGGHNAVKGALVCHHLQLTLTGSFYRDAVNTTLSQILEDYINKPTRCTFYVFILQFLYNSTCFEGLFRSSLRFHNLLYLQLCTNHSNVPNCSVLWLKQFQP